MQEYSNKISFVKNSRGCYSIDTIIGCKYGMKNNNNGCYGECYAYNIAKRYGYDFSNEKLRYFDNNRENIIKEISNIDMPFIRIGTYGDPSSNWEHTINIVKQLSYILSLFNNKVIVIITKHWKLLSIDQMKELSKYNVIFNTSISALDTKEQRQNRYEQYIELKNYFKSILRVVSCDFNIKNEYGKRLLKIQEVLFYNENIIDNILRVSKDNYYVKNDIIKIKEEKFLNGKCLISKFNKNTYFGSCENCPEMCGVNL